MKHKELSEHFILLTVFVIGEGGQTSWVEVHIYRYVFINSISMDKKQTEGEKDTLHVTSSFSVLRLF